MTVPLSLLARQFRLTGLAACIDAAGGGQILFYPASSSIPGTPETDPGVAAMGSIPLAAVCGTVGASGYTARLTFTTPRSGNVTVSGTVGWVRFTNGAGDGLFDRPAGLIGSGQPVELSEVVVWAGGEVRLVSCVIAE